MDHNARPDVSVIIVGLNARDYVDACLRSLAESDWRRYTHEITYVDNGSTDGTLEMIAADHPAVAVIAQKTNIGFCKAANLAAKTARGRYLYFLNDDTVVLDDAIALLIDYLDRNPAVGTVGSRLLYPDGSEQWSGRSFPTLTNAIIGRRSWLMRWFPNSQAARRYLHKDKINGDQPFDVDWISVAGHIVPKATWDRVGGYAEDYYYWHETVFCDRVRQIGQAVQLHPSSKVIHHEGKGSGPRPFRVQRFHIIDFHRGAWRCYCEHYRLGWLHPTRWVVAAGLSVRAATLLLSAAVRSALQPVVRPRSDAPA